MDHYFHILSFEERDNIRHFFRIERKDLICDITYRGLFEQSEGDLAPEEVWYEAKLCIERLKKFEPDELEIECMALFKRLNKRYSVFISPNGEHINRADSEARHSTMMVLYVVLLMLLDECETIENHPLNGTFDIFNYLIHDIDGLSQLHKATNRRESINEEKGKYVPIQNYRELDDLAVYNQRYGFKDKKVYQDKVTGNNLSPNDVEAIAKLKPFFFNMEQEAADFVSKIRGVKPKDVTAEVNRLLKERKVSDMSCKKPLWEILHQYGLYKCGISNWDNQINVPKSQ